MKIALLGGSFNPVHIGHLALADSVCCELGYEQVVFVPAFLPPHKELSESVAVADRVAMVAAAVSADSRFSVDCAEIDRGGISYTYDTVAELEQKFADRLTGKLGVILGSDLIAEYNCWYRAADLALMADLILAHRPVVQAVPRAFANQPKGVFASAAAESDCSIFPYSHQDLSNPELAVSSSDIRMRIALNQAWRYLVPEAVYHYIVSRNLYGIRSD